MKPSSNKYGKNYSPKQSKKERENFKVDFKLNRGIDRCRKGPTLDVWGS